MAVKKVRYFYKELSDDKQAVVLYTDDFTAVWDSDGSKIATAGGDLFDYYCSNLTGGGYKPDNAPDWQAPSDP